MKHYLLFLTMLLAAFVSNAQKTSNPPAAAKASFAKTYPNGTNIKWEKEGSNYEVNFKQDGREMSAEYNSQGILQETEATLKTSELPAPVTTYIQEHYKDVKIKEAAKITKANAEVNYEAEVKGKDLIFDKDGKFIKEAKKD